MAHKSLLTSTPKNLARKYHQDLKEKYEKERNLISMLKASVKNPEEVFKKIRDAYEALDFLEEARSSQQIIERFLPKSEAQAFAKILAEKKEKEKIVKKTIEIKSFSPSGLEDIKLVLQAPADIDVKYLGSSKFSISSKGKDFKQAAQRVLTAIEQIKNKAKEKKLVFEAEEK